MENPLPLRAVGHKPAGTGVAGHCRRRRRTVGRTCIGHVGVLKAGELVDASAVADRLVGHSEFDDHRLRRLGVAIVRAIPASGAGLGLRDHRLVVDVQESILAADDASSEFAVPVDLRPGTIPSARIENLVPLSALVVQAGSGLASLLVVHRSSPHL